MSEKFIKLVEELAPKLLGAVIALVVGIVVIKFLLKILKKAFQRSKLDPICHKFILSLVKVVSYIILLIIVLTTIGMNMTSLVAMLSVAGLAVSLAVQDSLSNLAGGFILLLSKPFSVGDYIEIGEISGTVRHINVLQTKLLTFDNKAIFIPNGQVSSAKIINYSAQDTRRIDLVFSIGYNDDFQKAEKIITDIIQNHELALTDPEPIVRICEFAQSSINITTKVWVSTQNYWGLYYDLLEQVKTAFDSNHITIPFNQLDVRINNVK